MDAGRPARSARGSTPRPRLSDGAAVFYALTVLVGACLLFVVQPLLGRLLLPRFGGAAAVWATCLMFFQVCVVVGYAYAHALTRWLPRYAVVVNSGLMVLAIFGCPLTAPAGPPPDPHTSPASGLLLDLVRSAALPLVAVAATSPLVQHWFAASPHLARRDPYALYAVSNLGSLLGLLGYPLLVEPWLSLEQQLRWYHLGFGLLAACELTAVLASTPGRQLAKPLGVDPGPPSPPVLAPTWLQALAWMALAMVPSALLQGVTTHLSTDLVAVPLLWVLPLSLYLLSFVLAFSRRPAASPERVVALMPKAVLGVAFVLLTGLSQPLAVVVLLHLVTFFVLCWACHVELARRRPPARWLTGYYLLVALSGALGGSAGALLAPALFTSPLEYALGVAVAGALWAMTRFPFEGKSSVPCAARELGAEGTWASRPAGFRLPVITVAFGCGAVWASRSLEPPASLVLASSAAAVACVLGYSLAPVRPWAFAPTSAALLLAPYLLPSAEVMLLERRTFFGVHRVLRDESSARHVYSQGTTIHGLQSLDPARSRVAGAYYHPTGPVGEVFERLLPQRVGLVGLGVGSMAAYAGTGDHFVFYEIDPVVTAIAEDRRLFTFLADARARGADIDVVAGDGRIRLGQDQHVRYELLVLDAYASDSVPVHLLTREAFALYWERVTPSGLLLLNVSNRYLDLGHVVAAIARDAGVMARERLDTASPAEERAWERRDGKAPSHWILLARQPSVLAALGLGAAWKEPAVAQDSPWTDDHASLLGVLR